MGRQATFAAAVVLFVGIVVTVTASGEVALVSGPPSLSWNLDWLRPDAPIQLPDLPAAPVEPIGPGEPTDSGIVGTIIHVLLVIIAAVLAVLISAHLWRNRPRITWRRRLAADDIDVLADAVEAIAADADAQRATLLRGTPRNAIVECWSRLETAVTSAGVPRHAADTSTDLTERVLTSSVVDATAIRELSALYREARFSSHEMREPERRAAIAALEAVHEGLRSGALA